MGESGFFLHKNITLLRKITDWKVLPTLVRNFPRSMPHKYTTSSENFESPPHKLFAKMNFFSSWNSAEVFRRIKNVRACWAYAYNLKAHAEHTITICIRMLSMRLQFEHVCWAYAYNLFTYAQHALTKRLFILTFVSVRSSCAYKLLAYAEHTLTTWTRMLSMRIQFVRVSWAYACQLLHIISGSNHIK